MMNMEKSAPLEENNNEAIAETQTDISEPQNPLETQINELKDQLLRALAENDNIRKRMQKEKEEALKFGTTNLAKDIINIADNLKRALENKADNAASMADALISGVDLILKDVESIFTRHGIEPIKALGENFDPHLHQAVFEAESAEHESGTVMQVVQDGYKIHDRLLRPAMVGVAKAK
jgi:molecular chaperone GrpE